MIPESTYVPETMYVGVYYDPGDIRIETTSVPKIGNDEMLVKTLATSLCASEAMDWYSKREGGKILGHEPVGRVAKLGCDVTGFEVGDRVFVNHHVGQMNSYWGVRGRFTKDPVFKQNRLDPGAMAEYFRVSAAHLRADVHKLPDSIADDVATTIEPWGCVLGGLKQCLIQPGDTVAVVGAGFMGLGFVHLAPLFGAGLVIALDLSDWRLSKASELGANHTINPQDTDAPAAIRSLNRGLLADVVVVTAPSIAAWNSGLELVEPGGNLHLGAPAPPGTQFSLDGANSYFNEITINSKYSADHRDTYQLIRLLEAGKVDPRPAITHRLPFAELSSGFNLLSQAGNSLKIVMMPPEPVQSNVVATDVATDPVKAAAHVG